jgi:hypothetical protein
MNVDDFIVRSINHGQGRDVSSLSTLQKAIFLLSQLEVICDMDGIDSFLDIYDASDLRSVAEFLRAIKANELANGLFQIADNLPHPPDSLLSYVNDLVSVRAGYDYDAIARVVAQRLASGLDG